MVIYGCSSCDLCFLIGTNSCVMKWSENVTSFGIKRDCNWLDLDKVSLKLASKNLVHSKLKPHGKGFPYGLLQAENIRSACCSRVVLSKLLAARKANFLSLLVLAEKSQCSAFVTPYLKKVWSSQMHVYTGYNPPSNLHAQDRPTY